VTVALRGTRWRHRLSLQTPQHNETIDVFYIKTISNLSAVQVRHSLRIRLCSTYLLFHRNNCCTCIACLVLCIVSILPYCFCYFCLLFFVCVLV